jgi:hypothetical protein
MLGMLSVHRHGILCRVRFNLRALPAWRCVTHREPLQMTSEDSLRYFFVMFLLQVG